MRKCHLCHEGHTARGKTHGLHVSGVGMLDCVCPISKVRFDNMVAELRKTMADMFQKEGGT